MQEKEVVPVPPPSLLKLFLKATGLALLFAAILLIVSALIVAGFIYTKLNTFATHAGSPLSYFYSEFKQNLGQQPAVQDNGHINFLLLGLDSVAGRGDVPPLTDTMMLVSLNLKTAKVSLLSLPRDIWNDPYKTKINALYAYGSQRYPEKPEQFTEEVLSEMTGIPIHYTLIISMDMVAEVIDTLGGLPITISESFTDPLFPRPGVDVTTERDPQKLYTTVTFTQGPQTLSGEQALMFMRSRHSAGDAGTDTDRNKRQYLVLQSLSNRLQERTVLSNPELMGKLFALYKKYAANELPLGESIRIVGTVLDTSQAPTVHSVQLPTSSKNPRELLYNPPIRTTKNQWMYILPDTKAFKDFVQKNLYE